MTAALDTRGFEVLRDHDASAPPLLWSESTSTLRAMGWRGEISGDLARRGLGQLADAPIERLWPDDLHEVALGIAEDLGWAKTYDAEYVALARISERPLLTRDARLRRGAGMLVEIIGPTEI